MEDWKKTLTDILQQEVTQEAMAEGNKTPEQEAVDFIEQELSKAREEGYREGKEYQAKLDREIYGMSFEEFDKKWKPVSKLKNNK